MATVTAAIDKQTALTAKVAAMTDAEKDARVQEIYALPPDQVTEDITLEFYGACSFELKIRVCMELNLHAIELLEVAR